MGSSVAGGSADLTTTARPATELAAFLAGVICGEGHFSESGRRFAFTVALGASDSETCHVLHRFLGVGTVRTFVRRKEHYDDEVVFRVQRMRDLVEVVVPFMDEHLRPSFKRAQYETWRGALLEHWEERAKRTRPCTVEGCTATARAKGRCRHHYYVAFGA